jgi:hypothetical protein
VIVEMLVLVSAETSIVCSEAGRQIDVNDEQMQSALASMRKARKAN